MGFLPRGPSNLVTPLSFCSLSARERMTLKNVKINVLCVLEIMETVFVGQHTVKRMDMLHERSQQAFDSV